MSESKKPLKAAVFGYLSYGNFGDDLMGFIFSRALIMQGCAVTVYGLNESIVREIGADVARSTDVEGIVKENDFVIYAGGGAFLSGFSVPGGHRERFEKEIDLLCEACGRERKPFYMFSVGGNGSDKSPGISRERLLLEAEFISFRNREDIALIQKRQKPSAIHEDVVWLTSRFFPREKPEQKSCRTIGVDVACMNNRKARLFVKLLQAISRFRPRLFKIKFINQHLYAKDERRDLIQYRSLGGYISKLAELDMIITHRLHTGMTAMSLGIPVFQLMPTAKARILFERLEMKKQILDTVQDFSRFCALLLKNKEIWELDAKLRLSHLQKDAEKHLEDLKECVNAFRRSCAAG